MTISARSLMTTSPNSLETGRQTAAYIADGFEGSPDLVVAHLTVNHEQQAFLQGMRDVLGPNVALVGCSTQGVTGRGQVREEGYAAGVVALGGDAVHFTHAMVEDIPVGTFEKGKLLGQRLKQGLTRPPAALLLYYDPLSGVDVDVFLAGLYSEVECPIVGGAAAHHFNYAALQRTHQYYGEKVVSRAAVAFTISGDVGIESDFCNGVSATGVEFTVTRAEGNVLYELDGRPAVSLWEEIFGRETTQSSRLSSLGIGIPAPGRQGEFLVRVVYSIDTDTGAVHLGSSVPAGTRIMLHHRTVEEVVDGARRMGERLRNKLAGRKIHAVFGFECGARTRPFLGDEATLAENVELQRALGGSAPWLGMLPWGEVFPVGDKPTFHNYSYPLLVLTDRA